MAEHSKLGSLNRYGITRVDYKLDATKLSTQLDEKLSLTSWLLFARELLMAQLSPPSDENHYLLTRRRLNSDSDFPRSHRQIYKTLHRQWTMDKQ
ncbi:MAG: hypothetical protein Fur006_53920 [Coleofasciculaceae cyanobacterium]